jgi:hypothetical protein
MCVCLFLNITFSRVVSILLQTGTGENIIVGLRPRSIVSMYIMFVLCMLIVMFVGWLYRTILYSRCLLVRLFTLCGFSGFESCLPEENSCVVILNAGLLLNLMFVV